MMVLVPGPDAVTRTPGPVTDRSVAPTLLAAQDGRGQYARIATLRPLDGHKCRVRSRLHPAPRSGTGEARAAASLTTSGLPLGPPECVAASLCSHSSSPDMVRRE